MKKIFVTVAAAILLSAAAEAKTLVAYFSFPIANSREAADASSGASVVPASGGTGNAEFIAQTVARTLGADLFKIDTGDHYPVDYGQIFNAAQNEQRRNVRPALVGHVADMSQYDAVILCYPIWWYRLPLAVHSFLDEYDLSGKTIYLAVTHGGSRLSGTDREIVAAEPNATVSGNSLALSRRDTARSEQRIVEWARSLGL